MSQYSEEICKLTCPRCDPGHRHNVITWQRTLDVSILDILVGNTQRQPAGPLAEMFFTFFHLFDKKSEGICKLTCPRCDPGYRPRVTTWQGAPDGRLSGTWAWRTPPPPAPPGGRSPAPALPGADLNHEESYHKVAWTYHIYLYRFPYIHELWRKILKILNCFWMQIFVEDCRYISLVQKLSNHH